MNVPERWAPFEGVEGRGDETLGDEERKVGDWTAGEDDRNVVGGADRITGGEGEGDEEWNCDADDRIEGELEMLGDDERNEGGGEDAGGVELRKVDEPALGRGSVRAIEDDEENDEVDGGALLGAVMLDEPE